MDNARYFRIFEPNASDDFAKKRLAVIRELKTHFLKTVPDGEMFKLTSDLIGSALLGRSLPEEVHKKTVAALRKQSPSFVADGCTLEMRICAVLGLALAIEEGPKGDDWGTADTFALGAWLASDFVPPMGDPDMEFLRADLHRIGRERVSRTGIDARDRQPVPDISTASDGSLDTTNIGSIVAPVLALRTNAELDREEIDLLFWLFGGRSIILGKLLHDLSDVGRAIVTGVEIGAMMRQLPSQAHRNLVLRHVAQGQSYSLMELLATLGDDRPAIASSLVGEALIGLSPDVFPLLAALISGTAEGEGATQQRTLEDWALRALLERSAITKKSKVSRGK